MESADTTFEYDLFISYAHIDNEPLTDDLPGWIDEFHERLKKVLAVHLGEKPRIWRDNKLRRDVDFDPEIIEKLARAAYLVSIVSPRYVRSKWCLKEVEHFVQVVEEQGKLDDGNRRRIIKVIKTYVDHQEHPAPLQGTLGYEFFQYDEDGYPLDLIPGLSKEDEKEFFRRLNKLVVQLTERIEQIRGVQDAPSGSESSTGITVYLAHTTHDLSEERDKIRYELEKRGHLVLPKGAWPQIGSKVKNAVQEDLVKCDLSIHLIGSIYAAVPEEAKNSIVEIQNDIAAARSKDTDFARLIWLPEDLEPRGPNNERQKALIEKLQRDPILHSRDDLVQSPFETFKDVLMDKLQALEEVPATAKEATEDARPVQIYLICDRRDLDAISPIKDYFDGQEGYDLIVSQIEGKEGKPHRHRAHLAMCDAVLIYYGQAPKGWLRVKVSELLKEDAERNVDGDEPMWAKVIYIAGPENQVKKNASSDERVDVIKNYDAFSPDDLVPFLEKIEQMRGGES